MKIQSVTHNNRKRVFQVKVSKKMFQLPYSKVDPRPTTNDPVAKLYVDQELGREGFTYVLKSGKEGNGPRRTSAGIQPGPALHERRTAL